MKEAIITRVTGDINWEQIPGVAIDESSLRHPRETISHNNVLVAKGTSNFYNNFLNDLV